MRKSLAQFAAVVFARKPGLPCANFFPAARLADDHQLAAAIAPD
jgi:hypothetical protein